MLGFSVYLDKDLTADDHNYLLGMRNAGFKEVFTSLTGTTGVCIGSLTVTGLTSGALITGWAGVFCTGTLVFTSLFVTTVLFCISFNR